MQLLANIVIATFTLLLVSLSFYLIYKPTRYFHIAHAASITIAPYICYQLVNSGVNWLAGIITGVCASAVFGVAVRLIFYTKVDVPKDRGLKILVMSLGIYIIFQNAISILYQDDIKLITDKIVTTTYEVSEAYITNVQIHIVLVSLAVFLLLLWVWHKTTYGKAIRAISENQELSRIFGIPHDQIILVAFALGSSCAGIAGILVGFDTGITPTMGFSLLLYGIVAMIIGGTESLWGIAVGAFILATAQNLTAYYIDTSWTDAVTYLILVVFLIFRPYGVSGSKIRKAEI